MICGLLPGGLWSPARRSAVSCPAVCGLLPGGLHLDSPVWSAVPSLAVCGLLPGSLRSVVQSTVSCLACVPYPVFDPTACSPLLFDTFST
ncbi:hypothetical protein K466DRAFT_585075 [Polyporus arcularius HHB13444]|uniref:Uncharacterized protein n=1 Tax=Polyporus arcularius HHB13444 TaxID=1314778 RepID=A0A5C3PJ85_9APHY|nr:hypothetical protein K466DRAFT_585075 [Polyporus arcularius HHB13444]